MLPRTTTADGDRLLGCLSSTGSGGGGMSGSSSDSYTGTHPLDAWTRHHACNNNNNKNNNNNNNKNKNNSNNKAETRQKQRFTHLQEADNSKTASRSSRLKGRADSGLKTHACKLASIK